MTQQRLLIAYATRAGSTAEIADALGDALVGLEGFEIEVLPIEVVKDVTGYAAVVIGSAIRAGNWMPEAVQFVEQHQAALRERPIVYFSVCITLHEDTPENRKIVAAYTAPVRAIVAPVAEEFFAGLVDPTRFSWILRILMHLIRTPQGDFRNWEAIQKWGESLPTALHIKNEPEDNEPASNFSEGETLQSDMPEAEQPAMFSSNNS
jgi:menaquinone-dependent protoporphyrinogen oxidase